MPRGITCKLSIRTGGTRGAPVFTDADLVSDMQVDAQWNEGESSVRGNPMQTFDPTNMAVALTGKIRKNITDTVFSLLRAAWLAQTTIDVLVLDGPRTTPGSDGLRFDARVFNFSEDQSLGVGSVFKEFTIKPTGTTSANPPQSAVVNDGGTLEFTTIVATPT